MVSTSSLWFSFVVLSLAQLSSFLFNLEHMARVKDRLIFENKKIEAVAQRKSNQEQKLRSKEAHANKLAEKSRRRKENLKAVDEWAQSAAANRGGKYNDKDDQKYLKNLNSSGKKRGWVDREGNVQTGPNKKRMAYDKKYGFGGKKGRFKQNTPESINDMSSFNPRGNFGGLGTKKSGGGSGGNRKGKRARDASRSRQRS
jgi:rRNA-processing protein EBP2